MVLVDSREGQVAVRALLVEISKGWDVINLFSVELHCEVAEFLLVVAALTLELALA